MITELVVPREKLVQRSMRLHGDCYCTLGHLLTNTTYFSDLDTISVFLDSERLEYIRRVYPDATKQWMVDVIESNDFGFPHPNEGRLMALFEQAGIKLTFTGEYVERELPRG